MSKNQLTTHTGTSRMDVSSSRFSRTKNVHNKSDTNYAHITAVILYESPSQTCDL
jgi:hypothetical protein